MKKSVTKSKSKNTGEGSYCHGAADPKIKDYSQGRFSGISVRKEVCGTCAWEPQFNLGESPCFQFLNGKAEGCIFGQESAVAVYFVGVK